MDTNLKILFQPQPGPQTNFIRCPVFEIFYGGARGGGSSFSVLLEWAQHAGAYGENSIGLNAAVVFLHQTTLGRAHDVGRFRKSRVLDSVDRCAAVFASRDSQLAR